MISAKTTPEQPPATATSNAPQVSHVTSGGSSRNVTQYGDGGIAIGGSVVGDVGGTHNHNMILKDENNFITLNFPANVDDEKPVTDDNKPGVQYSKFRVDAESVRLSYMYI